MKDSKLCIGRIGIIGAGRVGTTLGMYLDKSLGDGIICGYFSRTADSAREAAELTSSEYFEKLSDLVRSSDTLFITTPDGVIKDIWDCIADEDLTGKIVCHFSGSLSSNVFYGAGDRGVYVASVHPMFAFSDKYHSYEGFSGSCLVVEGQAEAVSALKRLFADELGHTVYSINTEDKTKYHAAAVMLSNHMISLYQAGLYVLESCGFGESTARMLVRPLIEGNVRSMLEKGPRAALTGPAVRGDKETIDSHKQALAGSLEGDVYGILNDYLYTFI